MLGSTPKYEQQTGESFDGRGRGYIGQSGRVNKMKIGLHMSPCFTPRVQLIESLNFAISLTWVLTSLYMFQYYLYHGTLFPFSNTIGHKSFLEIESNAFSKSINRERERERVNVIGDFQRRSANGVADHFGAAVATARATTVCG